MSNEQVKQYKPLANAGFGLGGGIVALTPFFYSYEHGWIAWTLIGVGFIIIGASLLVHAKSIKEAVLSRKGRREIDTWLNTLLVFGIILAVYLCFYFELFFIRHDFSRNKLFSLSLQTHKVLEQLSFPIEIKVFTPKDNGHPTHQLLTTYQRRSDFLKITYVDTHKYPLLAKEYNVTQRDTYVFVSSDKPTMRLTEKDFVKKVFNEQGKEKLELRHEEKLTATLHSFMETTKSHLYFLTGHGERNIKERGENGISKIKETLSIENITVKSHNSFVQKAFPLDADAIVIAGPKTKFADYEIKLLQDFLNDSGALFVLLDPELDSKETDVGLCELLDKWGFSIHNNAVIDTVNFFRLSKKSSTQFSSSPLMPILEYAKHEIVDDLNDRRLNTIFFSARSLTSKKNLQKNHVYQPVLNTLATGYGEMSLKEFQTSLRYNEGIDIPGPLCVGAVMKIKKARETQVDNEFARIAVYGDSGFIANHVVDIGANKDLFVNTIRWLLNQDRQISLRPKEMQFDEVYLAASQETFALFYFLIFQPGLLLTAGLLFVFRRK